MSDNDEQGLSLLDIADVLYEEVEVRGKKLRVYGVSAAGILSIFQRFPNARKWFSGRAKVNAEQLMDEAPDAIAAIIAAGTGAPGNKKVEKVAALLPVESQLDVLEAIGRLTFTQGFGPFVKRIVALSAAAQSVSYGRAPDMKSPPLSNPPSPPDTQPNPSGA